MEITGNNCQFRVLNKNTEEYSEFICKDKYSIKVTKKNNTKQISDIYYNGSVDIQLK